MPTAGLQIEHSSYVRAWIQHDDAAEPAEVSVLINDTPHWSGLARRLEHVDFDPNTPRTACGIWVALPLPSTSPQIVDVKLIQGEAVLAQASTDLSKRYAGFVDRIELARDGLWIEGWAHDIGRPLHPLELELRAGDLKLAAMFAAKHREDLAQNGVGLGNHAFSECIRALAVRRINEDSVCVVIAGTEIALPSSDTLIRSRKTPSSRTTQAPSQPHVVLKEIEQDPPAALVAGVCDKLSEEEILGWALDLKEKDRPVVLDLLINNFVVATTQTDRFRRDIASKHECSGYAGFHFEIIPQMRLGQVLHVAVMVRKTGQILPNGAKTIVPTFSKFLPRRSQSSTFPKWSVPRRAANEKAADVPLAVIVLNKNGAVLLDRHFQTFAEHNTYRNVEHVVVDHGSEDDSKAVVQKWQSAGIRINFAERGENYSFSNSNNYGAQLTQAEHLIFCNNDIFFTRDTLPAFVDLLSQEAVGIAGIKLLDDSKSDEDFGPNLVQHLGVFYNTAKHDRIVHPVEARYLPILAPTMNENFEAPAVTGAFLGIKRKDFVALGGFSEGYYYGYEDIDLCLRAKLVLKKSIVVAADTEAIHSRGYSRKKSGLWGGAPMLRNSVLLSGRFGLALRRTIRSSIFNDYLYWTATRPVIAFAVSEASATTTAGDFYTAYELANCLGELIDASIVFLEEKKNWYDVRDIDLLIAMTHNYDLSQMQNPKHNLVTVGWARNWFEEWVKPRRHEFDFLLSSSEKGAETMRKSLGHSAQVLRIATSPQRFAPEPKVPKTVDYVFTGSFWGHERDLISLLEPAALPYSCEIYGAGWESVPSLAPYAKGFVNYEQLPGIYRRAKVIIDDANHVTKGWGSVNSRVFDAISAGALPISNSPDASLDAFDGLLPCFRNREELENHLHRYCSDDEERVSTLSSLQQIVQNRHTYRLRASQFVTVLREGLTKMFKIAIKVPCPSASEAHLWGDYHFAQSLARELRALGHAVRIDFLHEWNNPHRLRDDAVICLRGLSHYNPTPDQVNICWLISHPDTVSIAELQQYDRVYVASNAYCGTLKRAGVNNAEVLLQCVDTDLFRASGDSHLKEFDVLFVGNSRNVMRPIIRDAISVNAPLTIIGSGWDELIPERLIWQKSMPHKELPETYKSARVILNDHWQTMAEHDFISNRLFDCVAVGAYVISDFVEGISELFGPLVKQYRSVEELRALIEEGLRGPEVPDAEQVASARALCQANSFRARARTISDFITGAYDEICQQRLERQPTRFSVDIARPTAESQRV